MSRSVWAATGFIVFALPSVAWACDSDSQCKGDRICEKGQCVAPSSAPKDAAPKAKAKPKPQEKPKSAASPKSEEKPKAKPKPKHDQPEAPKPAPAPAAKPAATPTSDHDSGERAHKERTSGLAIGAGFGFQTAGAGGLVAFYAHPGSVYFIAPYLGLGKFPNSEGMSPVGYAIGVMGVAGERHRAVFDVGYGLAGVETTMSGSWLAPQKTEKAVYGVTGALGYEYMHPGGFFLRAELGLTYFTDSVKGGVTPTLQAALGFKAW